MSAFKFLFACASAAAVAATAPPMPAFVWSPMEGALSDGNTELAEAFSASDVAELVKYQSGDAAAPPASLSSVVADTLPATELVVVFVQPRLSTADVSRHAAAFGSKKSAHTGALTALKTAVQSSPSSLSLPYVYKSSGAPGMLAELEAAGAARVHSIDAADAPAFLHGNQQLLSDGATDILVVRFDDTHSGEAGLKAKLAADDKLMSQVLSKADSVTQSRYVAVLTADAPSDSKAAMRAATISKEQAEALMQTGQSVFGAQRLQQKANGNGDNNVLYTTPGILSGLLVSLVLLMILSIGVMAMMALDTPDQFEAEGGYLKGS